MKKEAVVSAADLTIGYRTGRRVTRVHEHLSFRLYPGELTCLLGANGKIHFAPYFGGIAAGTFGGVVVGRASAVALFGKGAFAPDRHGADGQNAGRRAYGV